MTDRTDMQAEATTSRIRIAKAQLWEEAKGKLRAMVAVEGQCYPHEPLHKHHHERWRAANAAIEEFVRNFEYEGLHE